MLCFLLLPEGGASHTPSLFPLLSPSLVSSPCLLLSMLNSPCALQDEEVLEELPEEAEEDASSATTTTTKEEVGAQSSAVQVGQEQIPADKSEHCWVAASQMSLN